MKIKYSSYISVTVCGIMLSAAEISLKRARSSLVSSTEIPYLLRIYKKYYKNNTCQYKCSVL